MASACKHIDVEEYTVVQLEGYQDQAECSIETEMGIGSKSTRVANTISHRMIIYP